MSVKLAVVLGTNREGNKSKHVARHLVERLSEREDVEVRLFDPSVVELPAIEGHKIPEFSELAAWAEGFILISPEYNHSFSGTLKKVLDTEAAVFLNKSVGYVSVSKGSFGGVRMIESLIAVTRELGMIDHGYDLIVGNVKDGISDDGVVTIEKFDERIDKFTDHLVWLTETLNHGRTNLEA